MFTEMRRKDKQLEIGKVVELLKQAPYGILSTVGEHGYPSPVPISFVYLHEKLYFHSAATGEKITNIERHEQVSFCVVNHWAVLPEEFTMAYESAVVYGSCSEVFDTEKEAALMALIDKYSSDFAEEGKAYVKSDMHQTRVFGISIVHMTGKKSK